MERIIGTNKRYASAIDLRVSPRVPWHPIMDATELHPGYWALSADSISATYATVRLVRRGTELGYRAENHAGEVLGYFVSLRSAVLNAWRMTIAPERERNGTR